MAYYWGWRLFGSLARTLPRPLAYHLAGLVLEFAFLLWPAGRRAMRENLRAVLARDDPAVLAYWAARQQRRYGAYLVDAARLETLGATAARAECRDALHSPDWPTVEAAIQAGPVIFALMHLGNWDVCAGALAARMPPGSAAFLVPAEPLKHPALDATMRRTRAALGLELLPATGSGGRLLRALKRGQSVALLIDRPLGPRHQGVDVTFCGQPCRLSAGMARLALASGAPVIAAGAVRRASGSFLFEGFATVALAPPPTGARARDIQALTQAVLDAFAPWVRRHPDQWYQFRPFFQPGDSNPAHGTSHAPDESARSGRIAAAARDNR